MNIGIYFNNTTESEPLHKALEELNRGLYEGSLDDASIFYDNCGPNNIPSKCGFFNAVDIWHFTGELITTSIETTKKVVNIVNKFNTIFYYGWYEEKNPIDLIGIAERDDIKIVCNSKESEAEFVRLTGKEPDAMIENFELAPILEVIK
jgi:hypothetical protein